MKTGFGGRLYRPAQEAVTEVRTASQNVARAAEAQTVLLVVLTAVSVTALLVALIALKGEVSGAGK